MHGIYFHKDIMPTTSEAAYLPTAPDALVDALVRFVPENMLVRTCD
jgi:hypothetical protein